MEVTLTLDTTGERIAYLREECGLKQNELAKKIDVTSATMSRYESNYYDVKGNVLKKLVKELHTTSDYILGIEHDYEITNDGVAHLSISQQRMLEGFQRLSPEHQALILERLDTLLSITDSNK